MTTTPLTLPEFLLARYREDEAAARAAIGTAAFGQQTGRWRLDQVSDQFGPTPIVFALVDDGAKTQVANLEAAWERNERGTHIARHNPARVLDDVEAKRKIVDAYNEMTEDPEVAAQRYQQVATFRYVLEVMAQPYKDHPQYRQEWRRP